MDLDTYRTRFNEYLEWLTTEAGSFPRTVRLVMAYYGYDTTARREEFEAWLRRAPRVDCARCGRWFEVNGNPVEDELVLCPACLR